MGKCILFGFLLTILIFVIILPPALGLKYIKLLAVEETQDGDRGGIANLYIRTIPGAGNIFTATYPLTKFDTQISARFAKENACDYLDNKCNDLDFLYTITAGSAAIGGPS